jgi:hypothetical protein
MAFDASGNLLQTNDGGIVRLVNPNTAATRNWVAVVGDIGSAEFPSIAYDPLSNIVFGGTQDNGTPIQSSPGEDSWNQVLTGDGGVVGIDANQISHAGTSLRYYSFQSFIRFTRSEWNASNTMQRSELVGLNITAVGTGMRLIQFDPNIEFRQPFVLNAIDPARMLIGTMNLYESINRGDSLTNLWLIGRTCQQQPGVRPGHDLWQPPGWSTNSRRVLCRCRRYDLSPSDCRWSDNEVGFVSRRHRDHHRNEPQQL